jgi:multiple sugar transport system permease protein
MERNEARAAWLFLLPHLLGLLLFSALPILATLAISTLAWDVLTPPRPVGLANFRALLGDGLFRQVVANTAMYVAGVVPTGTALALGLAVALNRPGRRLAGATAYRTVFFLPVVVSSAAVAVVWRWLYDFDFGLLNAGLGLVGLPAVPWISSSDWALPSVMLAALWKGLGYDLLVFLAGLQTIPSGLYEAADLDGASAWQRFRHVTLPLLAPTTYFVLVVSFVRASQVFDLAYVLTGGGPANATNTVVLFVYQAAFHYFQMGYAAAAAWLLFLVVFGLTLLHSRREPGWVHDD